MRSNDQGAIIQALIEKDYNKAWEYVKYIGYKQVPSVNERYRLFNKIARRFNPEQNNNFIKYYKDGLSMYKSAKFDSIIITQSESMRKKIFRYNISPEYVENNTVLDLLKDWR